MYSHPPTLKLYFFVVFLLDNLFSALGKLYNLIATTCNYFCYELH